MGAVVFALAFAFVGLQIFRGARYSRNETSSWARRQRLFGSKYMA